MKSFFRHLLPFLVLCSAFAKPLPPLDLGGVREQQVMIPMRDGIHLSAYLYLPAGEGKWPAVFEQRYADISGAGTRKTAADLARRAFLGAKDARSFETQKEVRTWTTEPLAEPVEWNGEVKAEIWLSSTAPNTDVLLRVSDVYPDGRSMLIMDYPLRVRYREGWDKQVLLKPGEPARLSWHIGWTSIVFAKGHRIRVAIASTGAPLYEPNNQTGGVQTRDWMKEARSATNTIWHDAEHPSRIIVPILGK